MAEVMGKGKPVIGGFTGGITVQLVYGLTGFHVNSVEGAAFRIHFLLDNPEVMRKMGQDAREYVRKNFLITRHLGDYLALMSAGAYGFVMASNYNTRSLAAEVMVEGNQAALVRERQPIEDIWRGEKAAPWLR